MVNVFISDAPLLPIRVFTDQHIASLLSRLTDTVFTCQFGLHGLGSGLPDPTGEVVFEVPFQVKPRRSLEGVYTFKTKLFGKMDLACLQVVEGCLAAAEWDIKSVGVVANFNPFFLCHHCCNYCVLFTF